MPGEDSDNVALHDVSAYFSEEEWKLLHEWQKVLYRNVMKEIHQALISLGPLIATTVCSLRAQEKEELYSIGNEFSEGRQRNSPSDVVANPVDLFRENRDENQYMKDLQDTERREHNECLSTGFPSLGSDICLRKEEQPTSIFIDHFGVEFGESSTDPSVGPSVGYEVVSFHIKDEKETYCLENKESQRIKSISTCTDSIPIQLKATSGKRPLTHSVTEDGGGTLKKKTKGEGFEKCIGKTSPFKTPSAKNKIKLVRTPDKGIGYSSQLFSETTEELRREKRNSSESCLKNRTHLTLFQEPHEVQILEKYNDWKNVPNHAAPISTQPVIQNISRVYPCMESEKGVSKKEYFNRQKETQMVARPYQCGECKKSFSTTGTLIIHKRTHTGERPYFCTTCNKNFSQKGVLNRHQRIHLGERPYHCSECTKRFSQKGHLIKHLKTHNQNR